jgi:CheY-like chemotaxis protein
MASFRIINVNQQTEISKLIHSILETFNPDFKVVSVPSGEEALLEFNARNFDLLITHIDLPGIDGTAFLKKAKQRFPDLKTIMFIGGDVDQLADEISNSSADATCQEPINQAEFIDVVQRCLGLIENRIQDPGSLADKTFKWNLSDRLTQLGQALKATSSVLLDERGGILVRSGKLPDVWMESSLFPSVIASFYSSNKVAHFLKTFPPRDYLYFSGKEYDLILAHVSDKICLLEILTPRDVEVEISNIVKVVKGGVSDIYDILLDLGVKLEVDDEPEIEVVEISEELREEDLLKIDAIFQEVDTDKPTAERAYEFWGTFANQEMDDGVQNPDVLTYKQALKLGLAPDYK